MNPFANPVHSVHPAQNPDDGTVVIIANRGPHDFVWEEGRWIAKPGTTGLVSMITPLARQPDVAWFCCVSEPPENGAERHTIFTTARDQTDSDLNVVPVPLPADIYQGFYGEISNEILWMLQHHIIGDDIIFDEKRHVAWTSYIEANRRMAEAIQITAIPVRAFLIHDYHLYVLPRMLRELFPQTPSLHFLQIPFPDPSILKLLPRAWSDAILHGLLGADVVGFQTPGDGRSFLACCEDLAGVQVDYHSRTVISGGRLIRVRAFPPSTDPSNLRAFQITAPVEESRKRLATEAVAFQVVRVDRLDPSKNQVLGFTAFGRFLELHPEFCGKVQFLAFLIPARTDLTVYLEYHDAVYREVERINARFRDASGFDPIKVFYTNDRALTLAALEMADLLLAIPRHDGMNVTVKEWAILSKKPGVLVLSETAGIAQGNRANALLVSPLDLEGIAEAIATGLQMAPEERATRLGRIRGQIENWTATDWLEAQLRELGLPMNRKPRRIPMPDTVAVPGLFECELEVLNKEGIHARPAAAFVRCAREFASKIEIIRGEGVFSAKSILAVLTANLNRGVVFKLRAEGSDAAEAMKQLGALMERFKSDEAESK